MQLCLIKIVSIAKRSFILVPPRLKRDLVNIVLRHALTLIIIRLFLVVYPKKLKTKFMGANSPPRVNIQNIVKIVARELLGVLCTAAHAPLLEVG